MLKRLPILTAVLLAGLSPLAGCITEPDPDSRSVRGLPTQGVILNESVESVFGRVQAIVDAMTSTPLENAGVPNSFRTEVRGAATNVLVESRDAYSTAVHVRSDSAKVREQILSALMQ